MQTLATDEIAKSYRGRRVVNGVSLHINQAEVVGLLGPNGAGKTTSFYMIVGLVPPDSGRILVDGQDISNVPMYLRARNFGISYLPQEPSVFRKLSVEENIMAVLEVQPISWQERRRKRDQLIDELGLGHNVTIWVMRFPVVSGVEWKSRAHFVLHRSSSCWMNLFQALIRLPCSTCKRSFST